MPHLAGADGDVPAAFEGIPDPLHLAFERDGLHGKPVRIEVLGLLVSRGFEQEPVVGRVVSEHEVRRLVESLRQDSHLIVGARIDRAHGRVATPLQEPGLGRR